MRYLISSIFLSLLLPVSASDGFKVFAENGKYGLKDQFGEVAVPAVYDELGWSDGTTEVLENVIGFRKEGLWGLLSAKNKVLRSNEFYSIAPFDGRIKVAVRGKFSNQLFYGLLSSSGVIEIPLNYFEIDQLGQFYMVSKYYSSGIKKGLLNRENAIIVPISYSEIGYEEGWYFGEKGGLVDVYYNRNLVINDVNYFQKTGRNILVEKEGYVGLLRDGFVEIKPEYKEVNIESEHAKTIPFPKWSIHLGDSSLYSTYADSLSIKSTFCNYYRNGFTGSLSLSEASQLPKGFSIEKVFQERVLGYNQEKKLKQLLRLTGEEVLQSDQILVIGKSLALKGSKGWEIYNGFGTRLGRLSYNDAKEGIAGQLLVKRTNYWGVLNFDGRSIVPNKFDEIVPATIGYLVKFLGRWGVINSNGNWIVNAAFDEIAAFEDFIVGRKSEAHSYFNLNGVLLNKSVIIPVKNTLGRMVVKGDEGFGLLDAKGDYILDPIYDRIRDFDRFTILGDEGQNYYFSADPKEQFGPFEAIDFQSGPYVSVKENGRWGFADEEGRLRISNRYDSVTYFYKGLAAMFLRGRWGMINQDEEIVVQPYYDQIERTPNGMSIVRQNGKYGLIDANGKMRLEVVWSDMSVQDQGYLLFQSSDGKLGLANMVGIVLLRAEYDAIQVNDQGIIVRKGDKMGLIDPDGSYLLPIEYELVDIQEGFVIVKDSGR